VHRPRASVTSCLLALLLAGVVSCDETRRPWDGPPSGTVVDESRPFLPTSAHVPLFADPSADASASALPAPPPTARSRRGGLWSYCHEGFRTSGRPRADVTRLGLMCGPSCGMRLYRGATLEGRIGSDVPAAVHRFRGQRGTCYRLMVSASGIGDLEAQLTSGDGRVLARDDSNADWLLLESERPFCPVDDGELLLAITARRGRGRYAAQIWSLAGRAALEAADIDGGTAPK
jgi:hypothetical protein